MPVSAIFENLEAGANIDDIMEWFDGLSREQVKAVIEFAARSLDKTPQYAPLRNAGFVRSGNTCTHSPISAHARLFPPAAFFALKHFT